MIKKLHNILKVYLLNKKWRRSNQHNFTTIKTFFPLEILQVGKYTYGNLNVIYFGEENSGLAIGNYCSIANDTKFLLGGEHNFNYISTYPFKSKVLQQNKTVESFSKGKIIVEDDVWIGSNVLILSGVTIGKGSVIGAGSVVRKSVPEYSIYVDSKVIKKRFNDDIINELRDINWDGIDKELIREYSDIFYNDMQIETNLEVLKTLKRLSLE